MPDHSRSPGPAVYLPVHLDSEGQPADVRMIKLPDGQVALLAYTALDRLVDGCGDQQPWLLFETAKLDELRAVKPFDLKYLDVDLPEHLRLTTADGPAS